LVIGHLSLATGHWSLVIGHSYFFPIHGIGSKLGAWIRMTT